jgi:hypothetical protein
VLEAESSAELVECVVDVVERDGRLAFGGPGIPVEPAVCMRRLPESGMLPGLVERGVADEYLMARIARQLEDFHAQAATGPGVDEYGSPTTIRGNWDENFAQTSTLEPTLREAIRGYVKRFLADHADLLERRVREGRIREGHGMPRGCARRGDACIFSTALNSTHASAAPTSPPRWRSWRWTLITLAERTWATRLCTRMCAERVTWSSCRCSTLTSATARSCVAKCCYFALPSPS